MCRIETPGVLIAIEGPNGVGKSTIIEVIANELEFRRYKVLKTNEPSCSELGCWIREKQSVIHGRTLACLIAANRYEHIESVILPAINDHHVVLSDRYLASSFVYQVSDGVSPELIWSLNAEAHVADLTICLYADKNMIAARMEQRSNFTRFEQALLPEQEINLYRDACRQLRSRGWSVEEYYNNDGCSERLGKEIAELIIELIRGKHE